MMEQNKQNKVSKKLLNSSKTVRQSTPKDSICYKQKDSGLFGSIITIVVIIILGGGFYYYLNLKQQQIVNERSELQQQINELQHQQEIEKKQINQLVESLRVTQLDKKEYEQQLEQHIDELHAEIITLSNTDVKSWLLAQVNLLAKMAGQKLWNDYDPVTAIALLKSADASLVEMNDPNLIEIRKTLNDDISVLSASTKIDYEVIILRLNQLSSDIDNLRINDSATDGNNSMDEDSTELSNNIADWKQNLIQSWKRFSKSFITIRCRDSHETPLLIPNQDIYLRANIRAQLVIAAQAVPRHQEKIYKQSLEKVSTWIRIYFNTNDSTIKAFLTEVDKLIEQPIIMDIPGELRSLLLLDKALQKRIQGEVYFSSTPISQKTQPTKENSTNNNIKIVPSAQTEKAVKQNNKITAQKGGGRGEQLHDKSSDLFYCTDC
ncbi:MAG: uroporphyrinogen-III C-methyltransferase [Arsenophonus sp. NEOnobi-MAG3]